MNDRGPNALLILMLLSLPGVGRKTVLKMVAETGQQKDALWAALDRLPKVTRSQREEARTYAEKVLDRSAREGISSVTVLDAEFPELLRQIDDPPAILHCKGDFEAVTAKTRLAVIGTREPTSFGRASGRRIAATIAEAGAAVVSGLAKGCDAEAHWGCLEANGLTAAVMAHGLDRVYPSENVPLADAILEQGGCLISEYEVGKPPFKTTFVERDRLQSGLSHALILIETGTKGGSLHTVGFARKQGRPIACLQHPDRWAHEEKVQGNRQLIDEGVAKPLKSNDDLMEFLATATSRTCPANESNESPRPAGQLSMF